MTLAFLIRAILILAVIAVCCTGILLGRRCRHRDLVRAQLGRIRWYGRRMA